MLELSYIKFACLNFLESSLKGMLLPYSGIVLSKKITKVCLLSKVANRDVCISKPIVLEILLIILKHEEKLGFNNKIYNIHIPKIYKGE